MIRRPPTRIELRLEDLQEYENMKREMDNNARAVAGGHTTADAMQETPVAKSRQQLAEERLGLVVPKPRTAKQ